MSARCDPEATGWALVHNDAEIIVGRRLHDGSGMTFFQSLATAGKTLAFHPVNRSLGVDGSDGTVTLWDLDRSQPAAGCGAPDATVRALAFDSMGWRLAVVTDKDVRVWDLGLDYCALRKILWPTGSTPHWS